MRTVKIFATLAALVLVGLAPKIALAQPNCGGASLSYILRDERGKPLDADHEDLWIGDGWSVRDDVEWGVLPRSLHAEIGNTKFIEHFEQVFPCYFSKPVKLTLTYHGKSMNLVIHAETEKNRSAVVDSLPFQQGTFEHQMSGPPPAAGVYAAAGWKKISDTAQPVKHYRVAFVRGRVLDSVSGKPVSNARVVLVESKAYDRVGATNADATGSFAFKLRADKFKDITALAVRAKHPDYLEDFAIVVENRPPGPMQDIRSADLKLTRAVSFSGHAVVEKTGAVVPHPAEISIYALYPSDRKLWDSTIGGQTDSVAVNPDGTFSLKTAAGKNRIVAGDNGSPGYWIVGQPLEVDIGPKGLTGFVLKFRPQSEWFH